MYRIYSETIVNASLENCFDLSRSIDFHVESMADSCEKPVNGKVSGLIELGEFVEWEATHLFVKQRLSSKITRMQRPHFFVDEMVNGAFKSFSHKHKFVRHKSSEVLMIDDFCYEVPLGVLGRIANFFFVERYLRQLITKRNLQIKSAFETGQWRRFLEINA
jgi:hypothetical protein